MVEPRSGVRESLAFRAAIAVAGAAWRGCARALGPGAMEQRGAAGTDVLTARPSRREPLAGLHT